MPATKQGVNGSESPAEQSLENPPAEGQKSLTSKDDRSWENKARELERKMEESSKAMQQIQEAKEDLESRLDELNQKVNLTSTEGKEKVALKEQILKLRQSETAQPWMGLLNEEIQSSSSKTEQQTLFNTSLMLMDDFIISKSESLGIEAKQLEDELQKFVPSNSDKFLPHERARMAMKGYLADKDYQKRKTEFEQKEKEEKEFRETGTRSSQSVSSNKLRDAKSSREFETALADL